MMTRLRYVKEILLREPAPLHRRVAHQLMATRLGLARRARVAHPALLLSLHHVPNLLRSVRGTARPVVVQNTYMNYQIPNRLLA